MFKEIDNMAWPCPGQEMVALQWRLRYGYTRMNDQVLAAEIITAYMQMIKDPQRKREMIVRELRLSDD